MFLPSAQGYFHVFHKYVASVTKLSSVVSNSDLPKESKNVDIIEIVCVLIEILLKTQVFKGAKIIFAPLF